MLSFSMTSTAPKRKCHEAIFALVVAPSFWKVARSFAFPNPTYGDSGVLDETPTPTVVAATAMAMSARIKIC
jgi:hypothetical protein